MKSDILIVEPSGGLCNRMRVIVSAYHATEIIGKKLVLLWKNETNCNCSYTNLFNLPDNISGFVINNTIIKKTVNQIPKILGKDRFFEDADIRHWKNSETSFQNISKPGCIYIRTCETLYEPSDKHSPDFDYSIFRPDPDILSSLPQIFTRDNIIGIHIRRTDNIISIENSPIELFIENMDREVEEHHGNCLFFIASDDNETKKILVQRYGADHIFTRTEIELSRAAQNGIRDAYIDLLCLSRCKKIYGSYWSSFSRCAAAIGKIPLEICKR